MHHRNFEQHHEEQRQEMRNFINEAFAYFEKLRTQLPASEDQVATVEKELSDYVLTWTTIDRTNLYMGIDQLQTQMKRLEGEMDRKKVRTRLAMNIWTKFSNLLRGFTNASSQLLLGTTYLPGPHETDSLSSMRKKHHELGIMLNAFQKAFDTIQASSKRKNADSSGPGNAI